MTTKILRLFICVTIILFWQGLAYPQPNLDFSVPVPEGAQPVDTKDFFFAGRQFKNSLYKSSQEQSILANYYQERLVSQGFAKIKDETNRRKNTRTLRFKKEDLVVNIYLKPKIKETEIVISKYMEPPGSIPLEKAKLSAKDSFFAFPEKDVTGEDSSFIPRPPQGIRVLAQPGKRSRLMYTSPLSVEQLREFYKSQMPNYSWQLEREFSLKEGLDLYKSATGKSIPSSKPIPDGEDLSKIVADSYNLYFRGSNGFAEVIIFPNFVDRKLGSIVTINSEQGD